MNDITEHKRSEETLRTYNEMLRNISEGIFVIGVNDNLIKWTNDKFSRMFGYEPGEMIGKHVDIVNAPTNKTPAENRIEIVEPLLRNGEWHGEIENIRKDGTHFWCTANVSIYDHPEFGKVMVSVHTDITARKQAEESTKKNAEIFTKAFKASPEAITIASLENGRHIEVNDIFLETTGFHRDEVIGHTSTELGVWIDMNERQRFVDALSKTGSLRSFETRYRMRSGELRDFLVSSEIIELDREQCGLSFMLDITERKQAENALLESQQRLALAASSAHLGIWDWDITNNRMTWDDQMFCLYGIREKPSSYGVEIWQNGLHPDDVNLAWKASQAALRGEKPYDVEFRIRHPDGTIRHLKADGLVLRDESGKPIRMIGVNYDITERKQAEQERQKLEHQLNQAQKLDSLGLLAGGIAHDFNNLMGGIFGFLDMAIDECKDPAVSDYLTRAMNTIDRARALTRQLLTFAKGGAPHQKVMPVFPFVQESAQFALSGSTVSCRFDIPDNLWLCNVDKNQIGQVVDNIVINAQQAMPDGGAIEITARNISLEENNHTALAKGNYVKLSFKDSGIGIPKEIIARIFDPFYTTKSKGHGLGLSTCYSIIKRHNGAIDVESKPGKGSTFHVYLPASTDSYVASASSATVVKHSGNGTIIVMDDEESIRKSIASMLKSLGYSALSTTDGEAAIEVLSNETKAHRPVVALIFDLTIPGGMGGKEAVTEVRKLNKAIPVFVASGYADDPVIRNPSEHGFTASISKPFRKSELEEMLEKHLKKLVDCRQ